MLLKINPPFRNPLVSLLLGLSVMPLATCFANTDARQAVIQHFDRKIIGGGTQCSYVSVENSNHVAVANNLGLLLFDGGDWTLNELPNGAQAKSVAGFENLLYCGGQGFIGILHLNSTKDEPQWIDCTPTIQSKSGTFDDVWRMFVPPMKIDRTQKHANCAIFSCSEFAGSITPQGEYQQWLTGPIRNAATWTNGVAFQTDGFIHFFDWLGVEVEKIRLDADWKMEGVLEKQNQNITLLTHNHGIQLWNGSMWEASESPLSVRLQQVRANCIEQYGNTVLIGTSSGGILTTTDFKSYQNPYTQESGLISNSVLSMKSDVRGNLWVGLEGGVDLIKNNWPHRIPKGLEEIKEAGYSSLHLADGKKYWGTSQAVYSQSPDEESLKVIDGISGPIWSLSERQNDVWVCHRSGAGIIQDDKFHPIINETGVWNIWASSDPTIWYAGTYLGLIQIQYTARGRHPRSRWQKNGRVEGFDESSRFLSEESKGVWWVSHPYKGAFRLELDEQNRTLSRVDVYDDTSGFPSPLQINLCTLDKGMIFATSKGFYRWNPESDRMEPDSSALRQLIDKNQSYQRIMNSPEGDIWIFKNQSIHMLPLGGLSVLDDTKSRFAFMEQNPVPTPFESIEFLQDGQVCIPVERGFTYLTPNLMHHDQMLPALRIQEVTHLNTPNSNASIEDGAILLEAGVHALEFELTGLNSDWAGLLEYQWRIQNVAEQWSRPTSNSRITLSGLQPGTHEVEFRAFIDENIPCEVTPVTIIVHPYWYQLPWMRALGLLLSVSLVIVFIRRNRRILEADHLIQKQKEHNKRMEVERAMKASMEETEIALRAQKTEAKEQQLAAKNKELASATMHLVQKSQLIQTIDTSLQSLKSQIPGESRAEIDVLLNIIKEGGKLDNAWDTFTKQFDQVHVEFHKRITEQFPLLTKTDFKLCTYLRMNLSSKEIASLMFVSLRAVEVSRSRLRKRLGLQKDQNLIAFIQNI
ncbi:MAG: hypothetical protein CL834_07425 [Crocinitomicaceae bacterium]|nr:hypothetical protein [Crocinitomicaceae bacterium]